MTGTEKQIEYAENLKDSALENLTTERDAQHPEHYEAKSREGKTSEQLEKRDRMIAEMKKTIIRKNETISILENFTGNAGTMIDCCKMNWWNLRETQIGYRNYLKMGDEK